MKYADHLPVFLHLDARLSSSGGWAIFHRQLGSAICMLVLHRRVHLEGAGVVACIRLFTVAWGMLGFDRIRN